MFDFLVYFVLNKDIHILFNKETNIPKVVWYNVTKEMVLASSIKKRYSRFTESNITLKNSTYVYSGLDRGHLASDATFDYSKTSLKATYNMLNTMPMFPRANRGNWLKLERLERIEAFFHKKIMVVNVVGKVTRYKNSLPIASTISKILINGDSVDCYEVNNTETQMSVTIKSMKIDCSNLKF